MASRTRAKTWVEIDRTAVRHNVKAFKQILKRGTKLYAVVKSNAYGHGLSVFPQCADECGVDGFCVDSVEEGITLRRECTQKPILVLGYTLPSLFVNAHEHELTVTIASSEGLAALAKIQKKPDFHLKVDSGMHRHGIYPENIKKAVQFIKQRRLPLRGLYTHFASAKDINYPTYTEKQFAAFLNATKFFEKAGFKNILKHAAATSGTLINKKYHLDAVRVGIGLYGLWPSKELETQLGDSLPLKPALSWKTIVAEVKKIKKGAYVGYDLAYRAPRDTTLALLPVGYWHGVPRALSGIGIVLVNGREAPIVGRVSMDVTAIDVGRHSCMVGDTAALIGKSGKKTLSAFDVAGKTGTIHYEVCTRINPLIERIAK